MPDVYAPVLLVLHVLLVLLHMNRTYPGCGQRSWQYLLNKAPTVMLSLRGLAFPFQDTYNLSEKKTFLMDASSSVKGR